MSTAQSPSGRLATIRARRIARADARRDAIVRDRIALLRRTGAEPHQPKGACPERSRRAARAGIPIDYVEEVLARVGAHGNAP